MEIESARAGRLLRVSGSYFQRLAKAIGCVPTVRPACRGTKHVWGLRHVFAVAVMPQLNKQGVAPASVEAVARRIASASDEQLTACIANGRSWLALVGPHCVPRLLDRANVDRMTRERGDALREIGLSVSGTDVGPLWTELQRAATAAAETDSADITVSLAD